MASLRRDLVKVENQLGVAQVGLWRVRQSKKIRATLTRYAPDVVLLEPRFDLCITGVTQIPDVNGRGVARPVYDIDKLVQMFIEDGMSIEESMEAIAELQRSMAGSSAPVFVLALVGR